MQLVGQAVRHISFGRGIVTECSGEGGVVSVLFPTGEKRFLYPDAFSRYLTLRDTETQSRITELYRRRVRAEETERQAECKRQERCRQIRNRKLSPNAQAAFHVSAEEAAACLAAGRISAGRYLSGYSKGEPRIPSRLKPNSCCLLTSVPEGGGEKDRRILGAFMVPEDFLGEECLDGMVKVHEYYRVFLPECLVVPFWPFLGENGIPASWGRVPFRHFSNQTMGEILLHLAEQTADTEQGAQMEAFCAYFCQMNHLPVPQTGEGEQVPAAAGE